MRVYRYPVICTVVWVTSSRVQDFHAMTSSQKLHELIIDKSTHIIEAMVIV